MSVRVMSAVWDYGPADSTQRFVLLCLADNASDDGGNAYPSIPMIARKCAISERTVIRAIDALIKSGYVIRHRRKDTSNRYQIVLSALVDDNMSHTHMTDCHQVGDTVSHTHMTDCHQVGDTVSPTLVTLCHQGGDTVSHDPSINHHINHQVNREGEGNGAGAPAPPPPPASSPAFQPIPENVRQAKARRDKPDPETVPAALPVLTMLHELTGYWPGEANAGAITAVAGENPDRSTLARAVELWRASGNKVTNWLGICDWYIELSRDPDWTPQARFRQRPNGPAAPAPSLSPAAQAAERYVKAKRAILGENQ